MKEGIFVFVILLAIAGCIAAFVSNSRVSNNEIDRLQYVINLRETELKTLKWQYELLAQEYAQLRSDWINLSSDTLTGDEIKEFLANSIAPDSIDFNN